MNQLRVTDCSSRQSSPQFFYDSLVKGNNTVLSCSSFKPECSWILDSGETDHVCSKLDLFQSRTLIKPVSVQLPNGNIVHAHITGTVVFFSTLSLSHVLYVPNFNFNIVSTSKLCKYLSCIAQFHFTHCLIQDVKTHKMIGLAK